MTRSRRGSTSKGWLTGAACVAIALATVGIGRAPGRGKAGTVSSPRLYVFDCGVIKGLGVELFGFEPGEVPIRDFFVPCYLVVHPKGTLMWDVGVVPGAACK